MIRACGLEVEEEERDVGEQERVGPVEEERKRCGRAREGWTSRRGEKEMWESKRGLDQ